MLDNQLDTVKQDFFKYLESLGLSKKSHKNYRSDLSHFLGWLILKIRSFGSYIENLTEASPFISSEIVHEYKSYMVENTTSKKTLNRRLSTLRHLSKFMVLTQVVGNDFMSGIENESLSTSAPKKQDLIAIREFKSYLVNQKVSENTIKNYLSDIRQFFNWLESVPNQ